MESVYGFDHSVFRAIHLGWHQPILDWVFLGLSYLGLGQVQFLLALLMWPFKERRVYVAPMLVTVLVTGLAMAQGIKSVIGRDRPSNLAYAVPQEGFTSASFPSGHTTTSFACAVMLILLTRKTKHAWWGWVALALAAGVGVSRIYRGVHWPTDVIGGACLGSAGSAVLFLIFDQVSRRTSEHRPA